MNASLNFAARVEYLITASSGGIGFLAVPGGARVHDHASTIIRSLVRARQERAARGRRAAPSPTNGQERALSVEALLRLTAGVLLVGANAFFVAVEFALTRLRQFSRDDLDPDSRGLDVAWELTDRLEIHLTGCQVGISATSILLGIIAEPAVTQLLEPIFASVGIGGRTGTTVSVVVGIVLINLIHNIWGEQAPTYLGVERPVEVARRLAPALMLWSRIMKPLIYLGDGLAKLTLQVLGVEITRSWTVEGEDREDGGKERVRGHGDMRREILEVLSRGRVSPDRRHEILQTLEIERIPVRRVMVPRDRMTALDASAPIDENLDRIGKTSFSRYPLLHGDGETFLGTVYVPALLGVRTELQSGEMELAEMASPTVRVESTLPVSDLIDRLQAEAQELALVEEDGEVVGMVTITDAFEEIAGELKDPYD